MAQMVADEMRSKGDTTYAKFAACYSPRHMQYSREPTTQTFPHASEYNAWIGRKRAITRRKARHHHRKPKQMRDDGQEEQLTPVITHIKPRRGFPFLDASREATKHKHA
jgi:hypothetical protein